MNGLRLSLFCCLAGMLSFSLLSGCQTTRVSAPEKPAPAARPEQTVAPSSEATSMAAESLPPKALIIGVPFISWHEAANLNYEDKGILNPSAIASMAMGLEFWGGDRHALEGKGANPMRGWASQGCDRKSKSLGQLKGYLVRGTPLVIYLPLTPYGHQLPFTYEMMMKFGMVKGVTLGPEGPRSGNIGRIIALEDFDKFKKAAGGQNPLAESNYQTWRVAIGYDDDRRVIILHDPNFGPAWEVPYEQFEVMWNATGRGCSATYPPNFEDIQAKRKAEPYRARTPQERAAQHYVYGYALASTRKLREAEKQFREGLSIPGIGKGYEHLLYYELALDLQAQNDTPGAIEAARNATDTLPEDPGPWDFLAKVYLLSGEKDAQRKSAEAKKRAEALMKDQQAQEIVAKSMPSDFWIEPLGALRGWAAP